MPTCVHNMFLCVCVCVCVCVRACTNRNGLLGYKGMEGLALMTKYIYIFSPFEWWNWISKNCPKREKSSFLSYVQTSLFIQSVDLWGFWYLNNRKTVHLLNIKYERSTKRSFYCLRLIVKHWWQHYKLSEKKERPIDERKNDINTE